MGVSINSGERFNSQMVEAGRAVAAIMVVLYHASSMYALEKYGGLVPWQGLGELGQRGVDFFFVISGFIIYTAHKQHIGQPSQFSRYFKRRFIRIYPIYWLYLCGFLLLVALGMGTAEVSDTPLDLLGAFSLIRLSPDNPPLWVAWTLFHEVLFYAFFGVLIFNRRLGISLFTAWALAVILIGANIGPQSPSFYNVLTDHINLEFFFGMAASALFMRVESKHAWVLTALGAGWLLLCAFVQVNSGQKLSPLYFGAGFAVLLTGLVALEYRGAASIPQALARLGGATYSIYLVHSMVISISLRVATQLGVATHPLMREIGPFLIGAISVGVGYVLYLTLEKPMLSVLRRLSERASPKPQPTPVT